MSSLLSNIANRIPPANGIAPLLAEVGPSATKSPSTLREVLSKFVTTNGPIDEVALAGIIFFFSDKTSSLSEQLSNNNINNINLSSSLLGSLLTDRSQDVIVGGWNLKAVAQVLSEDYGNVDWNKVALSFDFASFYIQDTTQFKIFIDLYTSGSKTLLPLETFTRKWYNPGGQLSLLEAMMSSSPTVYYVELSDDEKADAAVVTPTNAGNIVNYQSWASLDMLQRLLALSDVPSLYRRVRDLFVKALLGFPEIVLCSMVRLQLRAATAVSKDSLVAVDANAGVQLKTDVMRELVPLFFRPSNQGRLQNAPAALRRLYSISPATVTAACYESWRGTTNDVPSARLATIIHIISIVRYLPSPPEAVGQLLNGSKDAEFSIAIAFIMCDNDYLQLKPWLAEKLASKSSVLTFAVALISYLRKNYSSVAPRVSVGDGKHPPLVSLENVVISLQLLQSMDSTVLSQRLSNTDRGSLGDNVKVLVEAFLVDYPAFRPQLSTQPMNANAASNNAQPDAVATAATNAVPAPSNASEDVEEMATQYFQQIYTSEQSIGEVVEMLKRFKSSGNSKENEIFACMVHNLFDEYRFFSRYPDKELRITGILFGALIQEQLVSSITLGIALRYVLEALRKPPSPPGSTTSSGKMFKFGMYALEQFKGRLHEWPQYCSHIVQIQHLKEGYADLVAEIEREMVKNQSRSSSAINTPSAVSSPKASQSTPGMPVGGSSSLQRSTPTSGFQPVSAPNVPEPAPVAPRVAEFGTRLGRAVTDNDEGDTDFESPPDSILDRVQFLINNLAPSNVDQKAQDLRDMLEPRYFGWLGQFLVVKRISTQANFHGLYLSFLDSLGEYGKKLVEAIVNSVYQNIGKLLRSAKITTSSSERGYLKNLGIWLGQITLARNRPILQIMLDCKELLLQGYECGKLIAVAPFLAKILEGAKSSKVFRPPNPWLMGILGVFRSVYMVEGLKMNIKFEVEVLCKNLGLKLEDIPLRNETLVRRIAPVKERNPDFNIKASSVTAKPAPVAVASRSIASPDGQSMAASVHSAGGAGGDDSRASTPGIDQQDTVIPNLAAYVTVNPSLAQLLQGSALLSSLTVATLKRSVPVAVDRAIREIIQPVVERSVNIACTTTREIVTKDFAMEGDETKLRKAGQLMVANLAGSLALVTCREPLRSSVSTHLRQLLTSTVVRGNEKLGEQDQSIIEQCVQVCATDNIELGCMLIEKAATEKAIKDVNDALSSAIALRRKHREQTGQSYYDMSIFSSKLRYPSALPDRLRPSPGGLRPEHYQLYDSFQRISRQNQSLAQLGSAANPGAVRLTSRSSSAQLSSEADIPLSKTPTQQFGSEALTALSTKLEASITSLLAAAGSRAVEIKLSMLPPDHQIRQILAAVKQVVPNSSSSGVSRPLTASEQELLLGFSQGVFKRLYDLSLSEPLRLEAQVSLLENINYYCPKLGKDIGTWSTYAPTNTEQQRRLHRTVLLLLVRSRLLDVHELDAFLAARADNGRNHIWVEFSLLFIRTAFLEQISAPSDFPKLMDLMTRVAEGRSQASAQVVQTYRKAILKMLEETGSTTTGTTTAPSSASQSPSRVVGALEAATSDKDTSFEGNSSLSPTSIANLSQALRKVSQATETLFRSDPADAKQQVMKLIDGWIRLQSETTDLEKLQLQYLQALQRLGIGRVDEHTERFLRLSVLIIVESCLKSASLGTGNTTVLNYGHIDAYAKLLVIMFTYGAGGSTLEQQHVKRLGMLNKILGVIVRSMMWHFERRKMQNKNETWDQRPWYRVFMNLVIDLNKPNPLFEPIRLGILSVFGAAFHVCQPITMPAFAFVWLDLISHRHFLPNVLLFNGQKGWNILHQLLVDHLLFLEPYLRKIELPPAIKKLYEGTLRVILVILHDFPSFLAGYCLSLCNVIPESCVQLRNIILSATPKGMSPPDPFTPNLKIDLLPEIAQAPTILSDVLGPISGFRSHLDAFLKDNQRRSFLTNLLPLLCKEGTSNVDFSRVQSLVLYVGAHALARIQNSQISLSRTPEMEVFQKLMEFDDKGRYTCLNVIANQLRYPSSHTHYFSCVTLYLFSESKNVAVKEQVTRVLLERLIVNRPHPWGLLITFIELIKNQRYAFWSYSFTRCATEIEKVFESVARSCMPPGTQRSALVGGDDQ